MTVSTILIIAALAASLFLTTSKPARLFAIIAAVVSGAALAMELNVLSIHVQHLNLIVGGALAILGGVLLFRIDEKMRVVASTVIASVGAMMLLTGLL